ncbi:MAG: Hydrogenase-4 component E [Candidatus Omnitrophica bacterium ADurb.Bin205]|nr:MAG: Hydrogenase-4 component E [Candidatus Omnitrophica bacterium ADurb.Bin205]
MPGIILFLLLASTYLMVTAKRMPALIRSFCYQSIFLFLATLLAAFHEKQIQLYLVAGMIVLLKVFLIPYFLNFTAKKIKVDENLGLFVNPQLSLVFALIFTYSSWVLSVNLGFGQGSLQLVAVTVAFSIIFIGAFLMISRMKAFTQVVGILVMENGIFLFAASASGGMPFFAEIAVFFDVFISVVIMGIFVFRINKLFTHIDVNKLSRLKG